MQKKQAVKIKSKDGTLTVYKYDNISFRLRSDQEPMKSAFAKAAEIGLTPQAYVRWLIGTYGTPQAK